MIFHFICQQHPAPVIALTTTLSGKSNIFSCSLQHLEFNRLRAEMRVMRDKDDLSRLFGSANPNRRCPSDKGHWIIPDNYRRATEFETNGVRFKRPDCIELVGDT